MTRGFIEGEYQDGEVRGLLLLIGKRGTGKTTEMDRLFSGCGGGVIFFDTLSKHSEVLQGYRVIASPGELVDYLRPNRGRRFRILYQPREGDLDLHFRAVCAIVRAYGWMIFGVDELDKLCGARFGDTRMCSELYFLVNYGRHVRVSMVATARRISTVAPGYRDEADIRAFCLAGQSNIEFFEKEWGKEYAAQLRSLSKFYFLRRAEDEEPQMMGGPRRV